MTDEPAGEPDAGAESESIGEVDSAGDSSVDGAGPAEEGDSTADRQGEARVQTHADEGGPDVADPTAYTTDVRTLDSRVRWLWIGRALIIGAFVGGIATAVAFGVDRSYLWAGPLVGGLVAALGVIHSILLYRTWSYEVRADSLFLDRGVITRVQTVVPYVRVQHIDTSRGPIERAVGLSTLVVYTAGSRGADVTVPGLTPPEADDLQTRLKLLAIESEGEDAV